MGLEIKTLGSCLDSKGTLSDEGKLHLDSKSLTFSSKAFKCTIDLNPTPKATIRDDQLIIVRGRESFEFHIPQKIERWLQKIQNPPQRVDKRAIKPGMACWLSRGFAKEFQDEVRASGAKIIRDLSKCDLAFAFVGSRDQVAELLPVSELLPPKVNVWVVWPKGSKEISQGDVMKFMGQRNFGPSKTAAFDDERSSMRFAKKSSVC